LIESTLTPKTFTLSEITRRPSRRAQASVVQPGVSFFG
jgi:hypothetical protein